MPFVIPAPGLHVRDPATMQPLPPEGAEVADSEHWQRRVADGDVTLRDAPVDGEPPAPVAETKPAPRRSRKRTVSPPPAPEPVPEPVPEPEQPPAATADDAEDGGDAKNEE